MTTSTTATSTTAATGTTTGADAAPPRVALLHTGAVVIAPVMTLVGTELPGVTAINYLDDKIVADLSDPARADSVPRRVRGLAEAAREAGAQAMLLTCSSISELAATTAEQVGLPILRIDEAMADEAAATGHRIAVVATLATTCDPTARLISERAALQDRRPDLQSVVVPGAFEAVAGGDRETHDRLVAAAIEAVAAEADVVVLAQASMASAAERAQVEVPVLTSLASGVSRLRSLLEASPAR